jgi:PAS domain S-box-containing protein
MWSTVEAWFSTFDVLPDAVIVADEQGRIEFANAAAARLLGWSADELRGRPLTTIMPPRMHAAHEAGLRRYVATHHSRIMGRPIRVPALRRDGSEVDIELTLGAANLDQGRQLIIGTLRDLSDRIELERQLKVMDHMRNVSAAALHLTSLLDVQRVVEMATELLVTEFDAALARIWLLDPATPHTLRLRASAGLSTRIAGSPREHIDITTHPFKIGVVARTRRPFVKNDLTGDPQFEQEWVRREKIEAATAFPLLVASDTRGVLVAFFRKRLQPEDFELLAVLATTVATAINDAQLYAEAQFASRARDEVLAVVSHDLRGPLSIIEMGTTALLRRGAYDAEVLQRLRRAGQRMSLLIHDLLDVSALEAGQLRMQLAAEAPAALVADALDLARPLADAKHLHLAAEGELPAARVVCDHERVVQVFANLLGNAIKFTDEGGTICVRITELDGAVRFAVTDSGIGIPPEQVAHVFDRFWQAGRRAGGGVGLGLAIAKGIVEAHHGSIRVESPGDGRGSTFSFDLPRAA